jgi:dTDP-4-amino-4,6-dideoxygalactose transaminase
MIPQTNPRAAYLRGEKEIDAAIARVLNSGHYILGEEVELFEQEFGLFTQAKHTIGVANGTDAIVIGLLALSVNPGDIVISVSHTAVATVAAIEMAGAVPFLVDTDDYYCMDVGSVEKALELCKKDGRKVGAIVPVHLYGQPADMIALVDIAQRFGVPIFEDCSQAHGAALNGKMVGSFGSGAAYSCYPTKNLGAIGDAGVLTTNDPAIAKRMKALRQYGWSERFVSDDVGRNSRLDELQAAILRVKLSSLQQDNERRREIAIAYDEGLKGLPITLPKRRDGAFQVFHQYVIACEKRDELKKTLFEQGIGTGIHYPVPVHLQPAYKGRIPLANGDLPKTTQDAQHILSLPMFPDLSDGDATYILQNIQLSFR